VTTVLTGRYRALAAVAGLPGLLVWGLLARLHLSATLVALVVVAADRTGSYGLAGIVTGALVLGQGVTGPLRGRTVDRRRASTLLMITSVAYGLGLVGLAALPTVNWTVLAGFALAVGLILPPVTQASRAKVAQLVTGPTRHTAYSVQSVAGELAAALGPALAAVGLVTLDPARVLAACGLLAAFGGVGLAFAIRRAGVDGPAAPAPRVHSGRGRPIMLIAAMTAVVAGYDALSLSLVAWGHQRGSAALGAVVYGVCSVGALLGGLVVGARGPGRASLAARLALIAAALVALALVLPPVLAAPVWVVAAVGLAGGTVAPAAAVAIYDRLADAVPAHRRAETFGWMASASTAGGALIAPPTGWLLDVQGPAVALAAAAALIMLVAAGTALHGRAAA
jgi:MFS family permease